jgi:hypothetical protein
MAMELAVPVEINRGTRLVIRDQFWRKVGRISGAGLGSVLMCRVPYTQSRNS